MDFGVNLTVDKLPPSVFVVEIQLIKAISKHKAI